MGDRAILVFETQSSRCLREAGCGVIVDTAKVHERSEEDDQEIWDALVKVDA